MQPRTVTIPESYRQVATCRAEKRGSSGYLHNTILVHKDFPFEVEEVPVGGVNITAGCTVPRCAACVVVGSDLTIANVHLCGGRYDDTQYHVLRDVKAKELKMLVENANPDIIIGDFNGERSDVFARKTLSKYPMFRDLNKSKKEEFLAYYMSAHAFLSDNGYVPLYEETDVRQTSVYGGVPDWMYIKKSKLRAILNVQVVSKCDCSDHSAVVVDIQLKT